MSPWNTSTELTKEPFGQTETSCRQHTWDKPDRQAALLVRRTAPKVSLFVRSDNLVFFSLKLKDAFHLWWT